MAHLSEIGIHLSHIPARKSCYIFNPNDGVAEALQLSGQLPLYVTPELRRFVPYNRNPPCAGGMR